MLRAVADAILETAVVFRYERADFIGRVEETTLRNSTQETSRVGEVELDLPPIPHDQTQATHDVETFEIFVIHCLRGFGHGRSFCQVSEVSADWREPFRHRLRKS